MLFILSLLAATTQAVRLLNANDVQTATTALVSSQMLFTGSVMATSLPSGTSTTAVTTAPSAGTSGATSLTTDAAAPPAVITSTQPVQSSSSGSSSTTPADSSTGTTDMPSATTSSNPSDNSLVSEGTMEGSNFSLLALFIGMAGVVWLGGGL